MWRVGIRPRCFKKRGKSQHFLKLDKEIKKPERKEKVSVKRSCQSEDGELCPRSKPLSTEK